MPRKCYGVWAGIRRWCKIPVIVTGFFGLLYFQYLENLTVVKAAGQRLPASLRGVESSGNVIVPVIPDQHKISDLIDFQATAYCDMGITKSGVPVAPGHVATDPRIIPLGSMIYIESPLMGGIYQVLDTGSKVKGKIVDIFIPDCERCKSFGRQKVKVKVLRRGFAEKNAVKRAQK